LSRCRSCTSFASWAAMTKQTVSKPTTTSPTSALNSTSTLQPPPDCPPDVDQLGRSTWTLLHTMAANYPTNPSPTQQTETKQFMGLFGKMYPCWVCADDFRTWMKEGNEPKVSSREEFGRWLCEAHNAVNVKLGKERFDCDRWEERWRTGWKDGRCD
jgi:mitochondrial FAD-linked sulfhydryl oxidase